VRRLIAFLLAALPLVAQQSAPPPAAPRETKVPQAVEKTLANGLRVIVVPKPGIPLVAARVMIKAGGAADPKGRDGLAQLTTMVIAKGTKTRSAEEIARGVEALGTTISVSAGWDNSAVDVSVMSSNLAKAMEYVGDAVRNPTFPKEDVDRERTRTIDSLQVTLQEPSAIASIAASRLVFGDAPYAHNLEGLPATVEKITRDDLVKFHRAHYRPENAVLLFAGDVTTDAAFALAERVFGGWKRGTGSEAKAGGGGRDVRPPRVVVIDMPEAGQAAVVVARRGIRRTDPAYMQAMVANAILGGGYSSRLNQKIRIERGLSYGADSAFEARAETGPFMASTQTKHESVPEVIGIITSEVKGLIDNDVPQTELLPRKAALIGNFVFSLETTSGIVNRVAALALYGLPLSDVNRYIQNVQAVTAADVRKFATSNFAASEFSIVVAGNAKEFLEPLRRQFSDVEVIKLSDLDLALPGLRVRLKKE